MQKELNTIIRRSCLTGKAVWLYRGHGTKRHADKTYCEACRLESKRIHRWCETKARRQKRITGFLNYLTSCLPILCTLTAEQRNAIRELQAIAAQEIRPDRAFYEHFKEIRRRRKEAGKWRQRNRQKKESEATCGFVN